MKKLIATVILLGGAGGGYWYYTKYGKEVEQPTVNTATIGRGTIREVVKATGKLEARRLVQVGSQVGGVVKNLYADFNDIVQKDEVIAELDPELLRVEVAIQEANINQRKTDITNQEEQLADAERNLKRQTELFDRGLANQQTVEQAELTVRQRRASINNAKSSLISAEASLNRATTNLSYTTIKSPVTGVVINRVVDVGQAVSASQNVAQFFTIATDLTELKLTAGVDEAEIGKVRAGMRVTFGVDSYQGQTFEGTVEAVRLNATTESNVVTYPVWVTVPNNDLKLKPSMTANIDIIIQTAENVVRVPSAALRFKPNKETYQALGAPEPQANQGRTLRGEPQPQPDTRDQSQNEGQPGGRAGQPGQTGQAGQGQPNQQARAEGGGNQPRTENGRAGQNGETGGNRQPGAGTGRGNRTPGGGGTGFGGQTNRTPEERERMMQQFGRGGTGRSGRGGGGNQAFQAGQGGQTGGRGAGSGGRGGRQPANAGGDQRGLGDRDAQKIDELFPERVPTISPGQVWTWDPAKKELMPHSVWTGITDGTFSELVRGDIQVGQVIVTSVVLPQPKVQPGSSQSIFGGQQPRGGMGGLQPGGNPGGGGNRGGGGGGGGRGGGR